MGTQKFPVCSACRSYGVPLYGFDNLCIFCYTTNEQPRKGLSPGHLPVNMEPDRRTTRTYLTSKELEERLYITQRHERLMRAKALAKEKKG